MKKSEIQFHSERGLAHPAVNVKRFSWPTAAAIAAKLQCTEEQAQRASEFAWEAACEGFWECIQETAAHYLGQGVKAYSEGRSSGWLVVHGLPETGRWDAIQLGKWSRFAQAVQQDIDWRASLDQVCETIEANQWHKDGAEKYNFIGDGVCIADLKQKAVAAGLGAVVR